ncbi:MAG: serine protease [Alphaproteobacteria bacterium]|nr:serine protease [Alphaproteobacteria bacterium]MCD8520530.1 serine protease [Alphaproteobacteria bacterium]
MKRCLILFLTLVFVTSCGPLVREVDYAPSVIMPEDARPSPIKWSSLELVLPPGSNVGKERNGVFCTVSGDPLKRSAIKDIIEPKYIKQSFHDAMEANGYDVVEGLDLIDEEAEDDVERAEYSIKAKLRDVQVDECVSSGKDYYLFYRPNKGERGELYVAIDWSVWDPVKRTAVYKTRTEGYTKRRLHNVEGLALMFHDAFEMATHNLASDPQFYDLIVKGMKPKDYGISERQKRLDDDWASRPRKFDPLEDVVLPVQPLSTQPFGKWAEDGRKAAVMVQKFGHGSGFFISKQGHILTTFTAVGDALRTRIVTSDRKFKIPAEVLRVDKSRNVALLKLEEIPEGLEITTLPIRAAWPKVGEDIYAIGAPLDWKYMTDTLTKGIVSAHRKNYKLFGVAQNYIQGDVEIHRGSDGGPLLDEYGNIIGITEGPYEVTDTDGEEKLRHGVGLNYFIPVEEALARLHILPPGEVAPQAATDEPIVIAR